MTLYKYNSIRGNKVNEDFAWANSQMGLVLDGASGLTCEKITPDKSDAKWFSHFIGEYLKCNLLENLPIPHILKNACDFSYKKYLEFHNTGIVNKSTLPSASIALYRCVVNRLELYILGDCEIIVLLKNKGILHFKNEEVTKLDNMVINQMQLISKTRKISMNETYKEVLPMLIKNRELKNTAIGYGILEPIGEGLCYGNELTLNKNEVEAVALMSDGFSPALSMSIYETKYDLMKDLAMKSLDSLILEVHTILEEDIEFEKYPRFKLKDDASVVFTSFSGI